MNNTIGIKEVAQLAGVSIGTVDRVLHNRNGVSNKTASEVRKIIKETGYKKNTVASRLKLAKSKVINIAVLFPEEAKQKSHYWNLPVIGIEKAITELKEMGIRYQISFFKMNETNSFISAYDKILDSNVDGIISVSFFKDACNELNFLTAKKNIPLVYIDTQLELSNTKYCIHQNAQIGGAVASRLLYQIIGLNGNYLVINLMTKSELNQNSHQREEGFRRFFKTENLPVHSLKSFNVSVKDLSPLINFLKSYQKESIPLGVFVTNSRAHLISPLLEKLNLKSTTLIGYDLNKANRKLLESNKIQCIINQKPDFQGYTAIKGLFKYLTEGEEDQLLLDIPVEIVLKENLNQ